MKLKQVMKRPLVSIPADYSVCRAAQVMGDTGFGFLAVVDNGTVVGVITGKDLAVRAAAKHVSLESTVVSGIMSSPPICLDSNAEVEDAIVLMRQRYVRRILVADDMGEPVGIVSMSDLEGIAVDTAIAKAIAHRPPEPHHLLEKEDFGIPGLYLG
jgi:CBS domain-containing protein